MSDGLCLVHSGRQNMAELGRRGGSVRPSTRLRQAVDEDLREQAREVLAKALSGEDVDKDALAAARSLYSFRPEQAPRGQERAQQFKGRGCFALADLLRTAVETGMVEVVDGQVALAGQVVVRHPTDPGKMTRATTSRHSSARQTLKPGAPVEAA